MKKRRSDVELTQDNYEEFTGFSSNNDGEGSVFQRASEKDLANRRVVRAKKQQARTPVVVPKTNTNTNPFSGVNLLNGGSIPPPRFHPVPSTTEETTIVDTTEEEAETAVVSVDLNDLVKLAPEIETCTENLSYMLYFYKKNTKIATGSSPVKSTGTNAAAPAPVTAAAPAPFTAPATAPGFFSFTPPSQQKQPPPPPVAAAAPPQQKQPPVMAAAPVEFKFPTKSAVASVPETKNDVVVVVPEAAAADENELMPQEEDDVDGIQEAADDGWKTIMKIEKAMIAVFENGKWKSKGIGRLKLLQDDQDADKFLLTCGNLSTRHVNAYVTQHANPQLLENTNPKSSKTAINVSLPVDGTSKLFNVRAGTAEANKLFGELEKIVRSLAPDETDTKS